MEFILTERMVISAIGGALLLYGYMNRNKERGLWGTDISNGEVWLPLIMGAMCFLVAVQR